MLRFKAFNEKKRYIKRMNRRIIHMYDCTNQESPHFDFDHHQQYIDLYAVRLSLACGQLDFSIHMWTHKYWKGLYTVSAIHQYPDVSSDNL